MKQKNRHKRQMKLMRKKKISNNL